MAVIVIGVDGSPQAERALRRGLQEALRFQADVLVIHAWLPTPYSAGIAFAGAPWPAAMQERIEADRVIANEEFERSVTSIQAEEGARELNVRCHTREGLPAPVLLEEAADAHTLVIGARGHGGFTGLLLGSVTDHCVRHARCPVLVVPDARDERRSAAGTRLSESLSR